MINVFKNRWIIPVLVLPALSIFTIFIIYPLLPTIYYSLFNYDGWKTNGFVGLNNFIELFKSPAFLQSIANTFKIMALQVFVIGVISIILALVMYHISSWIQRYFKITSFIPALLSVVVVCLMWRMIFQPQWGILDSLLKALHLEKFIKIWLVDKSTSIWAVGIAYLWQFIGFNMVLVYAGLKSVPRSYLEAAELEGASKFRQSISILLPLNMEIIKFVVIMEVTGTLSMFAHAQIITGGGPGYSTRTIVHQLYYLGFIQNKFGEANAIAIMYAITGSILMLLINKLIAKERIEYD